MPVKLIAPPHTPLDQQGNLRLDVVENQAAHFCETGVAGVFVCGSTGEGPSLSIGERKDLLKRWTEVGQANGLDVIAQVGSNCQKDSIELAVHAAELGVTAFSAMAPCYFKPRSAKELLEFFEPIAKAAESLPFYFYDIPALTGVDISTVRFLRSSEAWLPNLAGVKFTRNDMTQLQECLHHENGKYEIWYGCDESLLAACLLGVQGAVGSTYNFAATLYHAMIGAMDAGNLSVAREYQMQAVALIRGLEPFGYSSAAKATMSLLGIDCGPVRSPLQNLAPDQLAALSEFISNHHFIDTPKKRSTWN